MNVYTYTDAIGVAAVVVAVDRYLAAAILNQKLLAYGLNKPVFPELLEILPTSSTIAVVLCDGNY